MKERSIVILITVIIPLIICMVVGYILTINIQAENPANNTYMISLIFGGFFFAIYSLLLIFLFGDSE